MSGSAEKIARRDLRRAVGESALEIVDGQSQAIAQLVEVSNRSVGRLDATESEIDDLRLRVQTIERRPYPLTFLARLKWIAYGRA